MSDWSAAKSVTTRRALEPPTGVEANNIASTTVTMSWDDVPGAVRYLFMGFGTAGAVNNPQAFTGLTPNTTYTFKVGAENAAGETSDWSAEKSFTTLRAMIPPTGVKEGHTTSTTTNISWNDVPGAVRYLFMGFGTAGVVNNPQSFTGLSPNTTYTFKVGAENAAGETSDWSSTISIRTGPPAPTGLNVTQNNGRYYLRWTASILGKYYEVYIDGEYKGTTDSVVTFDITDHVPNSKTYTIQVVVYAFINSVWEEGGTAGLSWKKP